MSLGLKFTLIALLSTGTPAVALYLNTTDCASPPPNCNYSDFGSNTGPDTIPISDIIKCGVVVSETEGTTTKPTTQVEVVVSETNGTTTKPTTHVVVSETNGTTAKPTTQVVVSETNGTTTETTTVKTVKITLIPTNSTGKNDTEGMSSNHTGLLSNGDRQPKELDLTKSTNSTGTMMKEDDKPQNFMMSDHHPLNNETISTEKMVQKKNVTESAAAPEHTNATSPSTNATTTTAVQSSIQVTTESSSGENGAISLKISTILPIFVGLFSNIFRLVRLH